MTARLILEAFDGEAPGAAPRSALDEQTVAARESAAYEKGYADGLAEAQAAAAARQDQINEALASHLQDLAFTYQEARAHIIAGLRPVLEAMATRILPEIARASLPQIIADLLLRQTDAIEAGAPLRLRLHPGARAAVAARIEAQEALPLAIIEDAELHPDRAVLTLGETEIGVDLEGAVAEIRAAIGGFYAAQPQEQSYG